MSNSEPTKSGIVSADTLAALLSIIVLASCGGGGTDTATPTASLQIPSSSPTVTLTATPSLISSGATSTINWTSTNSTSCLSSGGGGTGTTGSFTTPTLTSSAIYTVACTGPNGIATQSTTVTVSNTPPTVTLSASPTSVVSGATATINWASTNSNSCVSSGGGGSATTGSFTTPALTTPTTYTVACTGPGGTVSQSATVSITASGICSTTGSTNAIALSNTPARLTGTAPLSVFFDTQGTATTPATPKPFHDLEYRWDYGDTLGSPVNGTTWSTGSRAGNSSRNIATGPVSAHVFERPGTYTVVLSITDGTNTVSNNCTKIVVQDPDVVFSGTNTICVGAASLPVAGAGGCPAGASTAQQASFPAAISSYAKTGKRLLFKRGDTFAAATPAYLSVSGPGIIGQFGTTGAAPRILAASTLTGDVFVLGGANAPNVTDWRIMDLEIDGQSTANVALKAIGNTDQITLLRLNLHHAAGGINFSGDTLEWNMANGGAPGHMFDQVAIVDNTLSNIMGNGTGMFLFGNRLSLLGNQVNDTTAGGQHVVRVMHSSKGVISNNTLSNPALTKQVFTLRAADYSNHGVGEYYPNLLPGDAAYTEQVVVSDNKFIAGLSDQPVTIGPSSSDRDGRIRNVIFERNWYLAGAQQIFNLTVQAQDTTIRNEIMDLTGAKYHTAMALIGSGTTAAPSGNVRIYNNTAYSNSAGDFNVVKLQAGVTNITVQNNLAYAPSSTSPALISSDSAGSATLLSNNSSNTQIKSSSPNFAATPPTTPTHYKPAAGSYVIGAGAMVPVGSDYLLTPQPATRDMGAVLH